MTHLLIEHQIKWPLGDAVRRACKLLPHEYVLLDVRADWDPSDDWVQEARYSIQIEPVSAERLPAMLDQIKAELMGMMDHALTAAIDNAKEQRSAG